LLLVETSWQACYDVDEWQAVHGVTVTAVRDQFVSVAMMHA